MRARPHAPIVGIAGSDKVIGAIPPCGVLPFKGFPFYAAALCYISCKPVDIYYIHRSMFTRYFCHLHSISSHPHSILTLCKTFEDLLQIYEPEVCFHLSDLGIQPLRIAFPWFYYSFIGYLEMDQVYLLWDRMIGFDTTEVLAVFAASVFVFRSNLILACYGQDDFEELFADLTQLKVVPLM